MKQNFLIGTEDGQTVAVHELTRQPLSRGEAADVLPEAVAAAGPGGSVRLLAGTYTLRAPLALPSSFSLAGSGRGTRLKAAPGFPGEALLTVTGADQVTVENLSLSPAETDGCPAGVLLHDAGDATLDRLFAVGFRDYGLILRGKSFLCRVQGCVTANNGKAGMLLQNLTHGGRAGDFMPSHVVNCTSFGERGSGYETEEALCVNFVGCQVFQAAGHGFWFHSTSNSLCVSGSRVFECLGNGALVQDTHEVNLSSNIFCWNKGHGVELNHAVWGTVAANNIIDSGGTVPPPAHGVYLHTDTRSVHVSANSIFNWDGHQPMLCGIFEKEDCQWNSFTGNNINFYSEDGVKCQGAHSTAADNTCLADWHSHPEKEPFLDQPRTSGTKEFDLERIRKYIAEVQA
ncbi:MAG: right-handed parallel beta-helix repeat-containing protein [Verrucomicrobiota bacterium]